MCAKSGCHVAMLVSDWSAIVNKNVFMIKNLIDMICLFKFTVVSCSFISFGYIYLSFPAFTFNKLDQECKSCRL